MLLISLHGDLLKKKERERESSRVSLAEKRKKTMIKGNITEKKEIMHFHWILSLNFIDYLLQN